MVKKRDFVDHKLVKLGEELPRLDLPPLQIAERILRISTYLRRSLDAALAPTGVQQPGFDVLAALRRAGKPYELTPSQLSSETVITSGAMTNRIDRLERAGLVDRRGHRGSDRRSVLVRLTPAGKKLIDAALPVYCAELKRLLEPMSQRDIGGLERGLRKAALALGDVHVDGVGSTR